MTKFLVTASKSKVIFRKVTKANRPLALLYDKLYRIDDDLSYSNAESSDSLVYYDIDEQQPYGDGDYVDPEFTKVLIDSLKLGKGKIAKMIDWNFETIIAIGVVMIIAWSILNQMLGGGM